MIDNHGASKIELAAGHLFDGAFGVKQSLSGSWDTDYDQKFNC